MAQAALESERLPGSQATLEELLIEGNSLIQSGRPIDGRAKLQQALQIAPKDFRPHMGLAEYYLIHVSHFKLAYRYITTAMRLFLEKNPELKNKGGEGLERMDHIRLLYLLSEAQLNLDKYEDSLATLDVYDKLYGWGSWVPGARAWVLMKLKRFDEGIAVSQSGLLQGADPQRTWNILGILFSVKGNRRQSLLAFRSAIEEALKYRAYGGIATFLNNGGEVYREMFEDSNAEASWAAAVRQPDGCEHVLPSLNLTHLYIDQLRFFQAERVLEDFEACFAAQTLRHDTEHRSLLALARGKIAMLTNDIDKGVELSRVAHEEQQWFGKIGTNQNDVDFASSITLAQAMEAKAAALNDQVTSSITQSLRNAAMIRWLRLRAWWLYRKARNIGLEQLNDLEDLFIRHTDAMVQYPTLGSLMATFNQTSLKARIERMKRTDNRKPAHVYYDLYFAQNLLLEGDHKEAEKLLRELLKRPEEHQRLLKAEIMTALIKAIEGGQSIFSSFTEQDEKELRELKENLFTLLPARVRSANLQLPVSVQIAPSKDSQEELLEEIVASLPDERFSTNAKSRYRILVSGQSGVEGKTQVSMQILDSSNGRQISLVQETINEDGIPNLVNTFITKAFSHKNDAPAVQLPAVPLLKGIS
jgi:tetratricopeptide (TPR) repeat protein